MFWIIEGHARVLSFFVKVVKYKILQLKDTFFIEGLYLKKLNLFLKMLSNKI